MSSASEIGEAKLSQLSRAELEQRVAKLEADNSELRQQRDEAVAERDGLREAEAELQSELEAKNEKIQKLIATLRRYENAHNPSGDQWPPTQSAATDGDDDGSDDTDQGQSDGSSPVGVIEMANRHRTVTMTPTQLLVGMRATNQLGTTPESQTKSSMFSQATVRAVVPRLQKTKSTALNHTTSKRF